MSKPTNAIPYVKGLPQEYQGKSFDTDFEVLMSEGLEYDGQNLTRKISSTLKVIPYSDSTYDYICEAAPTTASNTSNWRITRVNNVNGAVDYADGGSFNNLATSLEVVQGLTYS